MEMRLDGPGSAQLQPASTAGMKDNSTIGWSPSPIWKSQLFFILAKE